MTTFVISAFILYAFILWRVNHGSFILSPSAVHLAYLLLYVIVPAVTLYALDAPHSFGGGETYYVGDTTLSSVLLGLVGLAVGVLVTGRGTSQQASPRPDLQGRTFIGPLLLAFVLTFSFVIKNFDFMSSLNSFQALGDSEHYAMVQQLKADALYGSTYLLQGVHHIIPFIGLIFLAKYYCGEKRTYRNWAIVLIVFDLGFEILSGNLWVAIAPLVMVLMVRQYFRPATKQQMVVAGTLLVLLVVGLFVVKFGSSALENDDQDRLQLLGMVGQRMSSGAGTMQLIVETYPQQRSYEYGLTYVRDAVSLIPSPIKREFFPESWWGGFNGYVSYELGFYKATAQVPVMAEFYANFGMIGVLIGSVLYGMGLQHFSNYLRRHSIRTASMVVVIVVLGSRLAEATVEGIGGRFSVTCLWISIFFVYDGLTRPGRELAPQLDIAPATT